MSMSGGELKVLLALDKLTEALQPAYTSVQGRFRILDDGGTPTFESSIFSNNTGYEIRLEPMGQGFVTIYNPGEELSFRYANIFLSPTLDPASSFTRKANGNFYSYVIACFDADKNPTDTGFGYNLSPEVNAFVNFELRFYTEV